jgi:NADH-quinone oxidoreductase subunit I
MPTARRKLSEIKTINVAERTEADHERRSGIVGTLRALGVTFSHFVEQIGDKSARPTIQYPEERRNYSNRFRGAHILTEREDGSIKCVACYMCATACPAECIYIEAAESPDKTVEKYASRFEIDMMRCIFCGYCVDACPEEAIIMSRQSELASYTRQETVWGIDKFMHRPELAEYGPGYRPNYPLLESKLPFKVEKRGSGDEVHPAQTVRGGQERLEGGPMDLKKASYVRMGMQEFNEAPLVELPPLEEQGQRGRIGDLERERMSPEEVKVLEQKGIREQYLGEDRPISENQGSEAGNK